MKTLCARRIAFFSLLLVFFVILRSVAGETVPQSVLQRVKDATVMVCIEYGDGPDSEVNWGSGVIIGPGLAVTNAHVVNEKAPTRIYIYNEKLPRTPVTVLASRYDANEFTTGGVVEYIANTLISSANIENVRLSHQQTNFDMAVLGFTPPGGVQLPSLSYNLQASQGEHIIAAGYPGQLGGESSATYIPGDSGYAPTPVAPLVMSGGYVTALSTRSPRLVIHNARCSTGNSGGPVVNVRGEIVGMQTWTSVPGAGKRYISIAIGSPDIVAFLERNGVRPNVVGYPRPSRVLPAGDDVRQMILSGAEGGDPDRLALAGLLHFLGDCGFAKDDEGAAYYLQRALRIAPGGANAKLYKAGLAAVLFQSGRLWHPDYADALIRSANDDSVEPDLHIMAYESALRMQGKANGIRPDPNRSLQLAEKALEGGFALPFALAGYHYYFGDAYAGKDHEKALRYARQAASNDIPEGVSLLAHLYYNSDVFQKTETNRRTARRLAEQAARMGDPWAYGLLANIYYDSGSWDEKFRALKMALVGTCFGNRLALSCLGRIAWDAFCANPGDLSQAIRAWAYADLAEKQGVRSMFRPVSHEGGVLASSFEMLGSFRPEVRERILVEGQREQESLFAKRRTRPRIPQPEEVMGK